MELPPYSFIPKKNKNPNSEGGYRHNIPDPISKPLSIDNFSVHEDYLFALDLINNGYYWESHVYFEAIWHAHNRKGDTAIYCKALVKIAAGAIKYKQGRLSSANRLFEGSVELLSNLEDNIYLGIPIRDLIDISEDWMNGGKQKIEIIL